MEAPASSVPAPPTAAPEQLNVIALISGGKDSFFSALHCIANGHRLVALANLHPPLPLDRRQRPREPHLPAARGDEIPAAVSNSAAASGAAGVGTIASKLGNDVRSNFTIKEAREDVVDASKPLAADARTRVDAGEDHVEPGGDCGQDEDETDLNSFMYQTVGHEVIPLYADATGIPLYRQPIRGGALQHGREYADPRFSDPRAQANATGHAEGKDGEATEVDEDETESMLPLLRKVIAAHPEANALCAGAILSTYQRTRVESIAVRLGLVPLAFLWKFPVLPCPLASSLPSPQSVPAQLLHDLQAAGLEARIVKVASAGLDEEFLWTNVANPAGAAKVDRAMNRFGAGGDDGAVIGEGGEFETLVVDGPKCLFRKGRILVEDDDRKVITEGGGTSWLRIKKAIVIPRVSGDEAVDAQEVEPPNVRIPELWDARFQAILDSVGDDAAGIASPSPNQVNVASAPLPAASEGQIAESEWIQWCITSTPEARSSISEETQSIVEDIRTRLAHASLPPSSITNTIVLLRRMPDFPTINGIYSTLFPDPNPPARVTIACGDTLSSLSTFESGASKATPDINIAILLSVHKSLHKSHTSSDARQGLHVQSRSYWAPANIGPYSQAVSVPAASLFTRSDSGDQSPEPEESDSSNESTRVVSIAGQIPLVPATMALPQPPTTFKHDATLALQHLWRIGAEMDVSWWSGAVAYVPTQSSPAAASLKALESGRLWHDAHLWGVKDDGDEEDDEDEGGPDLWDRKYDARYAMLGEGETSKKPGLPNWDVLKVHSFPEADASTWRVKERSIPPIFLAEVAELPRAAPVEWHALAGLGRVAERTVSTSSCDLLPTSNGDVRSWHTTLCLGSGKRIVFSVLAVFAGPESLGVVELSEKWMAGLLREAVRKGCGIELDVMPNIKAELTFADPTRVQGHWLDISRTLVVPCASIWDDQGVRLGAIMTYRILLDGAV